MVTDMFLGKRDLLHKHFKDFHPSTNFTYTTEERIVKLDSVESKDGRIGLFFNRVNETFTVVYDWKMEKRQEGYDTIIYLVGKDFECFDESVSAFKRWLELKL